MIINQLQKNLKLDIIYCQIIVAVLQTNMTFGGVNKLSPNLGKKK